MFYILFIYFYTLLLEYLTITYDDIIKPTAMTFGTIV